MGVSGFCILLCIHIERKEEEGTKAEAVTKIWTKAEVSLFLVRRGVVGLALEALDELRN